MGDDSGKRCEEVIDEMKTATGGKAEWKAERKASGHELSFLQGRVTRRQTGQRTKTKGRRGHLNRDSAAVSHGRRGSICERRENEFKGWSVVSTDDIDEADAALGEKGLTRVVVSKRGGMVIRGSSREEGDGVRLGRRGVGVGVV